MDPDALLPLIKSARSGSEEDLGILLETMRPRLVLWVGSRMSPRLRQTVDAEDVAQDVLIAVYAALPGLRAETVPEFLSWFFTIARNRTRDIVAKAGALKRKLPRPVSFSQTSPSMAAARSEETTRMLAAIQELDETDREVIVLRRLEERTPAEVAEMVGKTKGAVGVALCRALERLAEAMARNEAGDAP